VDAAALTMRLPLARRARESRLLGHGLRFDTLAGPVVAVCGLVGGAGTTTVALALADSAARESRAPILLTEADPTRAGLAAVTGRATPRPLAALAAHLHDQDVPHDTFAELPTGLRLIAAAAQPSPQVDRDALDALLAEANAAHGLVVIDCSTSWTADSPALASATHIIWTTQASTTAAARVPQVLAALAPPPGRALEALAVTRVAPARAASVRALRRAVRDRCDRLVLIDHDPALATGNAPGHEVHGRALASLASLLCRRP